MMDGEPWWLLHHLTPSTIFFFVIFVFFIYLLIFLLRLKCWCNCDICHCYLTSGWSIEFENLCDWYTSLLQKSPTRTIHVHVLGNTITANPENVEYILKTRFTNYPKGEPFSSILRDLLGFGIFNVDGDQWKFQRKTATIELGSLSVLSFSTQIISSEIESRLLPLFESVADDKYGVLDLQDVFRQFAFDNICKISFGLEPGGLELSTPLSKFAAAFDLATKLSAERAMSAWPAIWKIKRLFKVGSEKKLKDAIELVNILAQELITQRRKIGYTSHQDLLSRFMATVDESEASDIYLRDIVKSFMLAGRDTVASTLTAFFWLISNHPDIERLIHIEVIRSARGIRQTVSFDELKHMHYLHSALYESMRLYPPVQFDSKFAVQDDFLPDGTFIEKGTRVTYHPYAMGRMEEIWGPDCLEFKPERWLENGIFSPASPFKYPIFQAGPRVCIGKEMALVEMKSIVASLLTRYKIKVAESSYRLKFSPGLTANLSRGLPVRISRKSSSSG